MIRHRLVSCFALAWFAAGCSSESSAGAPTSNDTELTGSCNVRGELSGAVSESLPGDRDLACALPFGGDRDLDTVFALPGGMDGKVGSLALRVVGLEENTKGDFDAELTVNMKDSGPRYGSKRCRVTITENVYVRDNDDGTFTSREFRVRGTGSCSEPLITTDTSQGSVEIGAFSFVTAWLRR